MSTFEYVLSGFFAGLIVGAFVEARYGAKAAAAVKAVETKAAAVETAVK